MNARPNEDLPAAGVTTPRRPAVSPASARRRNRGAVFAVLIACSGVLAACSSSAGGASTTPAAKVSTPATTGAGSSTGSSTDPVAAAKAEVARLEQPSNTFVAPGPSIDVSGLRGKSIWYVSLGQAIPVLAVEQNGLRQAASAVGMSLKICDGKFQPAVAAACVNSAISAGAAGIIMDSVTTSSVATAITNAKAHKVPVLAMSAIGTNSAGIAYGTNGDEASQAGAANWIVADSGGKATVLSTRVQDDTGAINDAAVGSQPVFDKCSGCKISFATYTSGTVPSVPSLISSTLLRNRNATYGFPQFDFLVPLYISGVRTAGMTGKLKIVSTNGVLSSMQMVKNGGQNADIASNRNYSGWLGMDSMLRMIKGLPVPTKWQIPIRIFDKTNIDSIPLTDAAAMTGEWFGPLDYQAKFKTLWGLN